jgi:hypothetical protein
VRKAAVQRAAEMLKRTTEDRLGEMIPEESAELNMVWAVEAEGPMTARNIAEYGRLSELALLDNGVDDTWLRTGEDVPAALRGCRFPFLFSPFVYPFSPFSYLVCCSNKGVRKRVKKDK